MARQPRRGRGGRRGAAQRLIAWTSPWTLDAHTLRVAAPKLLIALVVGLALVLILGWGDPPPRYHLRDKVTRDVISRVDFEVPDEEATREQREIKRQTHPSVYRSDTSALTRVSARLAAAVSLVTRSPDLPTYQKATSDLWSTLSPEAFSDLNNVIARKGEEAVRAAFEEMLAEVGRWGVIGETRKTVEVGEGRDRIIVQRDGEQQVVLLADLLTPQALRAWVAERATTILGETASPAAEALAEWCSANVGPSLLFEPALTKRARDHAAATTPLVTTQYEQGQTILARGAIIDEERFTVLMAEQSAFLDPLSRLDPRYRTKEAFGHGLLVLLVLVTWSVYFARFAPRVLSKEMRLITLGVLTLALVGVAKLVVWMGWPTLLIPAAFVAILLTVAYDERLSLVVTGGLLVLVAVVAGNDFHLFVVLLAGAGTAALASVEIRTRRKLMQVGGLAALAQLLAVAGLGLLVLPGQPILKDSLLAVVNGVGSALLLSGVLPLLERPFGIATGISLLELADPTQPLLRELALRAPGTYNHSVVVASLAEEAAQSIGANSLLARVGGYYHDIGKMRKPEYFVENQSGSESKHGRLSPTLSTLIITAHTRDGAELAEEFSLPAPVREIIEQHHGATLVEYFYKQAQRAPGSETQPRQEHFRYPGPKPRSKEAVIVMLADAAESASRVVREPSPGRIRDLVHELVAKRLADGQLDDCNLTLTQVHGIEESVAKSLIAIYHSRIAYA